MTTYIYWERLTLYWPQLTSGWGTAAWRCPCTRPARGRGCRLWPRSAPAPARPRSPRGSRGRTPAEARAGLRGKNVVRREVSYKDHEDKKVSVWLWPRTVDGELDPPLHGVVLEGAVLGHAADGGAVIRGGRAELERVDRVPGAGADTLGHLVGVLWNIRSS